MDKIEEVHHKDLSFGVIDKYAENQDLVKLCKDNSTKCFEEKSSTDFNKFVQYGKKLFVNIYLCFRIICLDLKKLTQIK